MVLRFNWDMNHLQCVTVLVPLCNFYLVTLYVTQVCNAKAFKSSLVVHTGAKWKPCISKSSSITPVQSGLQTLNPNLSRSANWKQPVKRLNVGSLSTGPVTHIFFCCLARRNMLMFHWRLYNPATHSIVPHCSHEVPEWVPEFTGSPQLQCALASQSKNGIHFQPVSQIDEMMPSAVTGK